MTSNYTCENNNQHSPTSLAISARVLDVARPQPVNNYFKTAMALRDNSSTCSPIKVCKIEIGD